MLDILHIIITIFLNNFRKSQTKESEGMEYRPSDSTICKSQVGGESTLTPWIALSTIQITERSFLSVMPPSTSRECLYFYISYPLKIYIVLAIWSLLLTCTFLVDLGCNLHFRFLGKIQSL